MTKKMTNADALALLAEKTIANTKAVKDLTALLDTANITPTNGSDGKTPYIQDGNWWIDGNDTGVRAEAKAGAAIKTFAFNFQIEVTPEDQEKIAADTHEIDLESVPNEILLNVGYEYANQPYLALLDSYTFLSGKLDLAGQLKIGKPYDTEPHQMFVVVFDMPSQEVKVPVYANVNEKTPLLASVDELIVKKSISQISSMSVKGYNKKGERAERFLIPYLDTFQITALEGSNAGKIVVDGVTYQNIVAGKMGKNGSYSDYLEDNLYRIKVNTAEGSPLEAVFRIGLPSQL